MSSFAHMILSHLEAAHIAATFGAGPTVLEGAAYIAEDALGHLNGIEGELLIPLGLEPYHYIDALKGALHGGAKVTPKQEQFLLALCNFIDIFVEFPHDKCDDGFSLRDQLMLFLAERR